ncbi:MAG: hypothetical protein HZC41_23950 [Chloroflexi bacterium]|nr:hypothetical protein [Chloroflexota bacterium]
MEQAKTDISVIHLPAKYHSPELDQRLPAWARRTNPIIRRQLGMYWKTILPEVSVLVKLVIVQVGLVALSLLWPFLFDLALPTITAALLLFPIALYLYGHILFAIGTAAALSIVDELRKSTFDLVRATPISLQSILASKMAASIWRQLENLGLLMIAVAVLSMPLLISLYATLYPLDDYPLLARVAMALGLIVSLLRLALEPFMIAAIGQAAGAAFPVRSTAVITTAFLGVSYFVLLNLMRLIPMTWPLHFVVEFVLPVVLPLLLTWGAMRLTERMLTRN